MSWAFHSVSERDRFLKYVPLERGDEFCWPWQSAIGTHGYGVFMTRRGGKSKTKLAHRLLYEALRGPIPEGLQIDHLCRNRSCTNPWHLEPVTNQENAQRGDCGKRTGALYKSKTHCKMGHPYSGDNLAFKVNGSRRCVTCSKARYKRFHARKNIQSTAPVQVPAAVAALTST